MFASFLSGRLRPLSVLAFATLVLGATGWGWAANWRPGAADYPVQGVDVSEADGPIDWWQARNSGVQFVYARATEGAARRDARFAGHWAATESAGLKRGALHVYSLCDPAAAQAGNFVSTVPRVGDQLPPAVALDFDKECAARPDRARLIADLDRFLATIETHLGRKAVLKVSRAFDEAYRISAEGERALWGVRSFFAPAYLARPWRMWQASTIRRVEGAEEPLNWDVMVR